MGADSNAPPHIRLRLLRSENAGYNLVLMFPKTKLFTNHCLLT